MFRKRGSIERKIVIALLIVGLYSGLVAFLFTFLTEAETLKDLWKVLILGPAALALFSLPVYFSAKWIVKPIKLLSDEVDLIGQDLERKCEEIRLQFSSSFAHDLRNPIIAIKKTIEMLRDSPGFSQEEAIKEVYTDLISTCGLLLGLVNDVLDIHQVRYRDLPLLYSSFSLSQALDEAVRLLRIEAEEKRVRIEIAGRDKDVWIEGDKRRIQRVFINLLSNAIRFSPPSGKVRMLYQTSHSANPSETANLLFRIEDEGPGIAPADLSRIFDLFYGKDRDGIKGGTGLGLYFCKVVVEAHGGRVWAENRTEGGAAFYIDIPLVRREADVYQNSHSG